VDIVKSRKEDSRAYEAGGSTLCIGDRDVLFMNFVSLDFGRSARSFTSHIRMTSNDCSFDPRLLFVRQSAFVPVDQDLFPLSFGGIAIVVGTMY
jgi:hypothetical protein